MRKRKVASNSILTRAKLVTEIELVITALFYGRSGTGKTTLSGSFPKPMLIVDIGERGTDSLADLDDVRSIQVSEWAEVEEIYWALKKGDSGYNTVVLDALHTMQALATMEAKLSSGKKGTDQVSQRDFGQASGLMLQWLYHFRDLRDIGINVVFLCHDKVQEHDTEDDTDMILPEVGPRLMPSLAGAVCGMVNVVGNTYIKEVVTKSRKAGEKAHREVQYCLRIGPHAYYSTKIRRPKDLPIPEFIVDPSYDKLVSVIKGAEAPRSTTKPLRRRTK
jgi:hypothetical protein